MADALETDPLENLLSQANKHNLTLIGDGLTKQHFIQLDEFPVLKGKFFEKQLVEDNWCHESNVKKEEAPAPEVFSTEVSEGVLREARKRQLHLNTQMQFVNFLRKSDALNLEDASGSNKVNDDFSNYLTDNAVQIKAKLNERANVFYLSALNEFKERNYAKCVNVLKKAISLNSINISFYLLKYEAFLQLCDFNSALLTINGILGIISLWTDKNDPNYDEIKQKLNQKITFCYYMLGQSYFDSKLYLDALESFNKASELQPENLIYKIRRILDDLLKKLYTFFVACLYAMNRPNDCLNFLNKIISEQASSTRNADLLILRARIHLKENNISDCFYDVEKALILNENHKIAISLMQKLKQTADNLRNSSLSLSLNNRVNDALNKLNVAITFNPREPEYYLQRGILHKRLKDFNSAIDDFLFGLEKQNSADELKDPILLANFQRQILLTYNDFSLQCLKKGFFDDAIILLNKAIKTEKNEKGLYLNRGDCFYKKNDKKFALLDYEQAHEIDPSDDIIKQRIAECYYEYGVEKYDEKDYKNSAMYFDKAIEYSPKTCKYYISRARILFLLEKKPESQRDICISILLDPANLEIPAIISRIFPNQNLTDVMQSTQMKEADEFLKNLRIKSVLSLKLDETILSISNTSSNPFINSQQKLSQAKKDQMIDLDLINKKKKIDSVLKETLSINLKSDKPKLAPLKVLTEVKKDPGVINWKRFNIGLNS